MWTGRLWLSKCRCKRDGERKTETRTYVPTQPGRTAVRSRLTVGVVWCCPCPVPRGLARTEPVVRLRYSCSLWWWCPLHPKVKLHVGTTTHARHTLGCLLFFLLLIFLRRQHSFISSSSSFFNEFMWINARMTERCDFWKKKVIPYRRLCAPRTHDFVQRLNVCLDRLDDFLVSRKQVDRAKNSREKMNL